MAMLIDHPDGHNDWPFMLRYRFHNKIYNGSITINSTLAGQVDFPRLRAGRVGGQLWSVWVPCPGEFDSQGTSSTKESRFADDVYGKAIHDTLQQVDLVKRMIGEFPEALIAAGSAQDVWDNYALSKTRISSITGAEGLHSIGNSASILRTYHSIGVRYMTLTHACHNKYADSASEPPYWHGLSEDGKAIVTEMNRIGMMVDLAHTSADTMRQTLDHTDVPLIFSHSSVSCSVASSPIGEFLDAS
jgi:membrane dipeptidase